MRAALATVRIESIAAGGAGVGRLADGRVVFAHRTAPDDLVEIELISEKKRFARGRLVRVLEPGAHRRVAPCPHYDRCGGCTLEHLEYHAQLAAKARIVRDALQRIAGLQIDLPEIAPSPREFRYRNRVSFTLVRTPRGRVLAGFHEIDRPDRILDISASCLLPEEAVAQAWGELRSNWGDDASLLPSGPQLRLTLRGSSAGGVGLLIEGGYSQGQPAALLQAVPSLTAIWHRPEGAAQHVLVAGNEVMTDAWSSEDVELGGSVFLQVNRAAAELLEQHV
ncbi:MAG TPA: TRAM domain-containing protein, partial [Longimicrobiales bacterium]|nr:TRAM domain-containing protein [Longimicrobiales bacterium]